MQHEHAAGGHRQNAKPEQPKEYALQQRRLGARGEPPPIAINPRKEIRPSPRKSSASAFSACEPAMKRKRCFDHTFRVDGSFVSLRSDLDRKA
jgi:hypothetical protein